MSSTLVPPSVILNLSLRKARVPKPYAHQVEAFERFKDSEFFGLFCDMGTGKSKIAIDI